MLSTEGCVEWGYYYECKKLSCIRPVYKRLSGNSVRRILQKSGLENSNKGKDAASCSCPNASVYQNLSEQTEKIQISPGTAY